MRVLDWLSQSGVDFTVKPHEEHFTAQEEAGAGHIPGDRFAKTVVVKVGEEYLLLALPASRRVDLARVAELVGAEPALATEAEMVALFPDCEVGAEPPFGSQYGLRTLVDESLAQQAEIACRPGNHHEVLVLAWADFARLEQPRLADFAQAKH